LGLRQTLARWRTREDSGDSGPPDRAGRPLPRHRVPAPLSAAEVGGRVVGPEQVHAPEPDLPSFYRPHAGISDVSAQRSADRELVRRAWEAVRERSDQLMRNFYAELFYALGDDALRMFPPGMEAQRAEFGRVLVQWVTADDPEAMTEHLAQLGADHRKFDVEPRHYEVVGQALVTAWSSLAGAAWNAELDRAVIASYVRLASLMIDGALAHRHEPASWQATVIEHRRVGRDFAVVRIQPDEPYAFKPGQYVTVELAKLPKHWRAMSVASAPRPDNTLELHVRAVSATGVSGALVMHTAVGDRVRLGPPRGHNLVLEPATVDSGVLLVCSGTGAAPIAAVVESMLGWPVVPPIYAFVGARTPDDLYPVEHLRRLADDSGHGTRLQVHAVVSDDPLFSGYHGRIEQVVPRLRNWAELDVDVLVAGPNAMIAATVRGLTETGVSLAKIHFDQYDIDSPH
jgi:NAD(P)H-flavin reductase/hemoglobin-like flavoprotein